MKKWSAVLGLVLSCTLFAGCTLDLHPKAGLQVMTNDVPSSVYLDGKFLNKTPYIDKTLTPGDYTLEIRPDDQQLAPHEERITLQKGLLTVVTWKPGNRAETSGGVIYQMEELHDRKNSEVAINTIPDGVIVHFDNEAKGFSPVLVEHVTAGEHTYEVSLPSYETQKNTINVLPGYRMDIMVQLAKEDFPNATASALTVDQVASPSASSTQPSNTSGTNQTASSQPSPSPATLPPPKVHIKHTGFLNNGKEVLRVRDSASPNGKELGFAPVDTEYPYLKETTNGWYKIQFNGAPGWVSGQFSELIQ